MKNAIVVSFLCAATSGICQSAAPTPLGPLELGQAPPKIALPRIDFSKLHSFALPRIIMTPKLTPARHWDDPQMDPKIITHPSQSRLGVQPPGTQVAQNEYPNLLLLPIDLPSMKPHITPGQWPGFALKSIPTQWPKFKLSPVQSEPSEKQPPPAK